AAIPIILARDGKDRCPSRARSVRRDSAPRCLVAGPAAVGDRVRGRRRLSNLGAVSARQLLGAALSHAARVAALLRRPPARSRRPRQARLVAGCDPTSAWTPDRGVPADVPRHLLLLPGVVLQIVLRRSPELRRR